MGMTRQEARTRTNTGSCDSNFGQGGFHAQDRQDAPILVLSFNAKNKVVRIDIFSSDSAIHWPSKAGATDDMSFEQVQRIYPGSVIEQTGASTEVVAARQGYRFGRIFNCAPFEPCPPSVYQSVVKRQK
ncbi:MAG: hypothetical protein U5L74_07255 [Ideonella sp.]|nr:hypothetical protein [Ideonella sp.]